MVDVSRANEFDVDNIFWKARMTFQVYDLLRDVIELLVGLLQCTFYLIEPNSLNILLKTNMQVSGH